MVEALRWNWIFLIHLQANFIKQFTQILTCVYVYLQFIENEQEKLRDLTEEERYRYFGILQLRGINRAELKNIRRQKCLLRIRNILKSHPYKINKVKEIYSFAIPVLNNFWEFLHGQKLTDMYSCSLMCVFKICIFILNIFILNLCYNVFRLYS